MGGGQLIWRKKGKTGGGGFRQDFVFALTHDSPLLLSNCRHNALSRIFCKRSNDIKKEFLLIDLDAFGGTLFV